MNVIQSIPASQVAAVQPNVLAAGGVALDVIALVLTTSTAIPIGVLQEFSNDTDVDSFFGAASAEAGVAAIYFNGFDNSAVTPDSILYAQYPLTAVGAYLRSSNSIGNLTLAQLQTITGTLNVVVDGANYGSSSVNLSAATSFSNAATIIQTDLNTSEPNLATFTGTIASQTLTVTAVASGVINPGQTIAGAGITGFPIIVSQLTSTAPGGALGAAGTYHISAVETVASPETITSTAPLSVTYSAQLGSFVIQSGTTGPGSTAAFATGTAAAPLFLTSATGAVLSQGAAAATPATFMSNVIGISQDWVTFMTAFDPDQGNGNTQKLAFAEWNTTQNQQFAYVCWDPDINPTTQNPATGSLGYQLAQAQVSGTFLVWGPDYTKAAFACGIGASIDFTQRGGRTTWKFRSQGGLSPDVTNGTIATTLAANGYNFYGAYATRTQKFNFLANGVVSGEFDWMDTYINQIQMNASLQEGIILGLTQNKSVPYNSIGYATIESWCLDAINAGINFGSIVKGVTLSAAQIQEVNQAAGLSIASVLSSRGWYLQVSDAAPSVRQVRGSPPCTLWYCDGGSIQKVVLDSIVVQ